MKHECDHENLVKLEFVRPGLSGVHGPYYEVWRVRCATCPLEYEECFDDQDRPTWGFQPRLNGRIVLLDTRAGVHTRKGGLPK